MLLDLLAAGLAGTFLFMIHAPFEWPWLAWIAPAPLIFACHGRRGWARMILGLVCGLIYFGFTFRWILLHKPALFYAALCVGAAFMALFGLATAWIESREPSWYTPALYPVFWLALLFAFGFQPMGNYWAHHAGQGPPLLRQLSALGGSSLMTFVGICVACHLGRMWVLRRRLPGTVSVGVLVLLTMIYGGWRLSRPLGGEVVTIGIVQPNFPEKRDYPQIFARYHDLTLEALRRGAQVVVWPQYALDEADLSQDPRMQRIFVEGRKLSRDFHLVLGTYEWRDQRTHFINLGQVYDAAGRLVGEHAAVNKPPGRTWSTLGATPRLISVSGAGYGLLVCYEDTTPHVGRALTASGATLLFSLMNDYLFVGTNQPAEHLETAVLRAVENGRYLVRNSNSGYGALIDPCGRILDRTELDREALLVGAVHLRRERTVFSYTGDWMPVAAALLALGLLVGRLTFQRGAV